MLQTLLPYPSGGTRMSRAAAEKELGAIKADKIKHLCEAERRSPAGMRSDNLDRELLDAKADVAYRDASQPWTQGSRRASAPRVRRTLPWPGRRRVRYGSRRHRPRREEPEARSSVAGPPRAGRPAGGSCDQASSVRLAASHPPTEVLMRWIGLAVIAVGLGLGSLVAPLVAAAQPTEKVPRIGLLADAESWEPLRQGLHDL